MFSHRAHCGNRRPNRSRRIRLAKNSPGKSLSKTLRIERRLFGPVPGHQARNAVGLLQIRTLSTEFVGVLLQHVWRASSGKRHQNKDSLPSIKRDAPESLVPEVRCEQDEAAANAFAERPLSEWANCWTNDASIGCRQEVSHTENDGTEQH